MAYLLASDSTSYAFNQTLLHPTVYAIADARSLVAGVEALGHAALLGLALAVGAITYRAHRGLQEFRSEATADPTSALVSGVAMLRTLLYTGAITLVAGTLQSSALYGWASAVSQADADYLGTENVAQVMGMLTGSLYSLLLAVVFIPGFITLRRVAEHFAAAAHPSGPPAERVKWLSEHSLAVTLPRQVLNTLAVLAPTLAGGPLIAILEAVST